MKRYIALLRGININGKNKVPMAELRQAFGQFSCTEVKTCLNSGNVVFASDENDTRKLTHRIEARLEERFGFAIPVFVTAQEDLADILQHAPDWWGQ